MVSAADMKWSREAMEEAFYLNNICPQHPELNQKGWRKLENKVRKWAVADSAIIVICGPIISKECETIGNSEIKIPDAFFKVALSPFISTPQAIGFILKNEKCAEPLKTYIVSVDCMETLTGIDFFSTLSDDIAAFAEAHVDTAYWGIE